MSTYIQLANNFEITKNMEGADNIVFVGTYTITKFHILDTSNYIYEFLKRKKIVIKLIKHVV